MAFGRMSGSAEATPLAEINMIPLIDVMLVMLVIFIVTAPLLTHAVKLDLPRETTTPNITRTEHVELSVTADAQVFWNGERVSAAELAARMGEAAKGSPQPELHIRADRTTQYQNVADVMAAAARAGLTRIGFISDPRDAR
jgi:biopolymer transport protein ExbD